jgi:hypothetical protein
MGTVAAPTFLADPALAGAKAHLFLNLYGTTKVVP